MGADDASFTTQETPKSTATRASQSPDGTAAHGKEKRKSWAEPDDLKAKTRVASKLSHLERVINHLRHAVKVALEERVLIKRKRRGGCQRV
jgi:hypothetical protein